MNPFESILLKIRGKIEVYMLPQFGNGYLRRGTQIFSILCKFYGIFLDLENIGGEAWTFHWIMKWKSACGSKGLKNEPNMIAKDIWGTSMKSVQIPKRSAEVQ